MVTKHSYSRVPTTLVGSINPTLALTLDQTQPSHAAPGKLEKRCLSAEHAAGLVAWRWMIVCTKK